MVLCPYCDEPADHLNDNDPIGMFDRLLGAAIDRQMEFKELFLKHEEFKGLYENARYHQRLSTLLDEDGTTYRVDDILISLIPSD